ncbi:MAG: sigma-70 family RNA polymerase sigma factor [Nitrospirota bacterium]|nr:sigma-70 family RNA polymerase sigma factor [Nitrospirota bacterium]
MKEEKQNSGYGGGDWELLRMLREDLKQRPVLSREDESRIARRAQSGDEAAAELLVESNIKFVIFIVRKYWRPGLPFMDMVAEGCQGLMRAAKLFDPERGIRLIAYAKPAISRQIIDCLKDYHKNKHNSLDELLGDKEDAATRQDMFVSDGDSSIIPQIFDKRRNGNSFRTAETKCSAEKSAFNHNIRRALLELNDRERKIIILRYWCDLMPEEVGVKAGLSISSVARIEATALRKLRWELMGEPTLITENRETVCVEYCAV